MKTKILTLVTLAILGLSNAYSQVGIGTTTPDASAALDVESTTKGFLPPRMDTDDRDLIGSPADGLTIYNTDVRCLDTYNGVRWIACNTIGATDVYNPVTGQVWMDRNLGASQVATSSTDAASYGDLYQWGRAADGHEDRFSTEYTAVETGSDGVANFNSPGGAWDGQFITRNSGDNNWVDPTVPGVDDLWQGVNGTNNPCPSGYRIPTEAELNAERLSWSSNNAAGAFDSPLKLPVAGSRNRSTGGLPNVGSDGFYWSSTVSGTDARRLYFNSSNAIMRTNSRAFGSSVRCLKD